MTPFAHVNHTCTPSHGFARLSLTESASWGSTLDACAQRCRQCKVSCRFLSYSKPERSCKWYRFCDMQALQQDDRRHAGTRTIAVHPERHGKPHGRNITLFLHTPKTGGTTINHWAKQHALHLGWGTLEPPPCFTNLFRSILGPPLPGYEASFGGPNPNPSPSPNPSHNPTVTLTLTLALALTLPLMAIGLQT